MSDFSAVFQQYARGAPGAAVWGWYEAWRWATDDGRGSTMPEEAAQAAWARACAECGHAMKQDLDERETEALLRHMKWWS